MLYVVVPRAATTYEGLRLFSTYSSMEQAVFEAAREFERAGFTSDWCIVIGYDGTDEQYPIFIYTLVGTTHLVREYYPTRSP